MKDKIPENPSSLYGDKVKIYEPSSISNTEIGDYSYIACNSNISYAKIGKFCSIGPNLLCGWGIHPVTGISTHPMFYSTKKQNGFSLSNDDKIEERKEIIIGNDVFIGANVTILDGVKIGNGAIIGAGAVVIHDIPDYAIAVGVPAKVKKYRFNKKTISKLNQLEWWNWEYNKLQKIEENFFNVKGLLKLFN